MSDVTALPTKRDFSEIRANWRLLFATTLGTGLGFPCLAFYSIGIFAPLLTAEFHWSFASILGGLSLIPIVLLFGGPWIGHLIDKQGPRKIAAVSLVGLGVSYITLAFSTGSIVQYYASWIAIAVTGIGATPISYTRAVNGAFVKRRGLALGITLAGIGLFALTVKPLGAFLIQLAGWRAAIVVIGLLPIVIGAPVVLWGLPAKLEETAALTPRTQVPVTGLTVLEALRTRALWILVVVFVPLGFANAAPLPNMENILRSLRIEAHDIVTLTSLIGVALVAGRLVGGWLIDRIWAPLAGGIVLAAAAFACWLLSQDALSYSRAMLAVGLLGFAGGLEVDLLSYLIARYIGVRSYGMIYGTLFGLFAIGGGFGPSLLGLAYDRTGTYSQIMQLCAAMLASAGVLLLFLGRYPDRFPPRSVENKALPAETRSAVHT